MNKCKTDKTNDANVGERLTSDRIASRIEELESRVKALETFMVHYRLHRALGGKGKCGNPRGKVWTFEKCAEIAKACRTKSDLKKRFPKAYSSIVRNGFMDEFTWLEDGRSKAGEMRRKWSMEKCLEEARKYGTRTEFARKSRCAYDALRRDGLLGKCEFWNTEES